MDTYSNFFYVDPSLVSDVFTFLSILMLMLMCAVSCVANYWTFIKTFNYKVDHMLIMCQASVECMSHKITS